MKTIKYKAGMKNKTEADKETRIAPTRFIWIPGIKPDIVPAKIPRKRKTKSSINIRRDAGFLLKVLIFL